MRAYIEKRQDHVRKRVADVGLCLFYLYFFLLAFEWTRHYICQTHMLLICHWTKIEDSLRILLVNLIESTGNCEFGHIY